MSYRNTDQYVADFDGRTYLDTSYNIFDEGTPSAYPFLRRAKLQMQYDIFRHGTISGGRLLEIGCGPCIDFAIIPCPYFQEIYLSDFNQSSRNQIQLWRQKDPDAFDWSGFFKYITDMEGKRASWEKRQDELMSKVKAVLHCDVLKTNPLDPVEQEPFDCIITSNCLVAACAEEKDFVDAMKNITGLLKPGGHFVSFTSLDISGASVCNKRYKTLPISEEFNRQSMWDSGLYIKTAITKFGKEDKFEIPSCPSNLFSYTMIHAVKTVC